MTDHTAPTEPTVRDSRLILAALLVTHEHDDHDGAALLLNQLAPAESTAALDLAVGVVRRLLTAQPGGVDRWLRTYRRVEVILDTPSSPQAES